MSMDMGRPISLRTSFFLMVAQSLVEVTCLSNVLWCPPARGALAAENIVSALLLERGPNGMNLVLVGFSGSSRPIASYTIAHIDFQLLVQGWRVNSP